MNTANQLAKLKRLQSQIDAIRAKLGISMPGSVLYQSPWLATGDDLIITVADGFGGATTCIVEGNYPIDFCTKFERHFDTEQEAEAAAEAIATGDAAPTEILQAFV
jgi:hypothetical protein